MNARVKLSIEDAADIVYATWPKGWCPPPSNEIDQQRAAECREEWKREADEYSADGSGSINWED